jgi:hypothetical protein
LFHKRIKPGIMQGYTQANTHPFSSHSNENHSLENYPIHLKCKV